MKKIINNINEIKKIDTLLITSNEKQEDLFYTYDYILNAEEINSINMVEKLVEIIIENKIKTIVFAHYNYLYKEIIEKLKIKNNKIQIGYIWFGSHCLFSNQGEEYYMNQMLDLYNMDLINELKFTNHSTYEYYKLKGYNASKLDLKVDNLDKYKSKKEKRDYKLIGLYFNKDSWETNIYNQLSACAMIKNAKFKIYPFNALTKSFCKMMNIEVVNDDLIEINKIEDRLYDMAKNDLNLHVSFTEIEMIKVLESFALGVPCLVGKNSDILKDKKEYVVNAEDNVDEIANKINLVLGE